MSSGKKRAAENDERFAGVKNYWGSLSPEDQKKFDERKLKFGEAAALYRRDCKFCGGPLGFGRTFDGKTIPLDLRAPVYCVTGEKEPSQDSGVVRTHMAFVSHWATCPEWKKAKEAQAKANEGEAHHPATTE